LASGDQIATISSLAYRLASTLGIVTNTQLTTPHTSTNKAR
jgi:hypothetical protein